MAITDLDIKILWGRAGGKCSKPSCEEDLTSLAENGNYVVGEMAHIIGRKPTAARGTPEGGSDTYDNLILLCPTHHTLIDKAPEGKYTVEILNEWKKNHEAVIRNAGKTGKFDNFKKLRLAVAKLLIANKTVFDAFGPASGAAQADPMSNSFSVWELRRIATILPNNRKILNIIDSNQDLIEDLSVIQVVEKFRAHIESYEKHVYYTLDNYQLFPMEFSEVFL